MDVSVCSNLYRIIAYASQECYLFLWEDVLTFAHNFSPFIKGNTKQYLIRIFAVTSFSCNVFEMGSLICFLFVSKN